MQETNEYLTRTNPYANKGDQEDPISIDDDQCTQAVHIKEVIVIDDSEDDSQILSKKKSCRQYKRFNKDIRGTSQISRFTIGIIDSCLKKNTIC